MESRAVKYCWWCYFPMSTTIMAFIAFYSLVLWLCIFETVITRVYNDFVFPLVPSADLRGIRISEGHISVFYNWHQATSDLHCGEASSQKVWQPSKGQYLVRSGSHFHERCNGVLDKASSLLLTSCVSFHSRFNPISLSESSGSPWQLVRKRATLGERNYRSSVKMRMLNCPNEHNVLHSYGGAFWT